MDERELKFLEMEKDVNARGGDGEAVVAAYKELYGMHEVGLCSWLAGLFDPDIGGFYHSNSGRDNEWIEWEGKRVYTQPDIESTLQAVTLMRHVGIIKEFDEIPDWMREKIMKYTCSLQSEEDGHIYHPQWGKTVNDTRRGRDLGNASALADIFKFKLPYPTALERINAALAAQGEKKDAAKATPALSEHLRSKEAFLKYLENLPWEAPEGLAAYGAGNSLAAQGTLIKAAGLYDVMCDFLDSIQHKDTGLWGAIPGYPALNAFFKIGVAYGVGDRVMPNIDKVAYSAMDIMCDPATNNRTVCYQFNAWWTLLLCYGNLRKAGKDKELAELKAEVLRRAPECILATKRKTEPFKCSDGSYSCYYDVTCPTAGGMITSLMIKEGDTDATTINSQGVLNRSLDVLGLQPFAPKIYGKEGHDAFFSALRTPTK